MSPNSPMPIDPEDLEIEDGPQPVPVPVPVPAPGGATPQPVPVPPKKTVEEEAIALVEDFDEETPSQRRAFGAGGASTLLHQFEFQRPVNVDGSGATRCKLFHSKISDGPLVHMQQMINEWLDSEKIEVKFVTQSIGIMEGKRAEPNVIVLMWY